MSLRIPGLASGMDTDMMVESMMKAERLKVSRYEQSKQVSLWRQEAYNSMNKMFANFILNTKKDLGLNKTTSTGLVLGSSYNNLDYIRKAVSSNENVATVRAGKDAVNGSYSIKVDKLANGASFTSADMKDKETFEDDTKFSITTTINGKDVVKEIEIKKGESMSDVAKKISSAKVTIDDKEVDLGVTAFYDKDNGRLFMQTTATGLGTKIELKEVDEGSSKDFVEALNGVGLDANDPKRGHKTEGTDAQIEYNGIKLNYSSNNINFNGINIELKATSTDSITMKVDTNVDGIFDKITKLIDDYNELVDKAGGAIGEKRYSNYQPLSQDEKKAMHEDDVKLWTEKAKSGMLNRDENLTRILQNIRTDLYKTLDNPDGSFNHITQIGISTEKYAKGSVGGKLQIDEQKLREAIMEDPEGVMELLFKEASSLPDKPSIRTKPVQEEGVSDEEFAKDMDKYKEELEAYNKELREYEKANKKHLKENNGIFTNIYDNLIDGMKSIIDKSGTGEEADLFRNVKSNMLIDFVTTKSSISDLDKEVLEMNKRIDNLNILLARKEQSYYAKFANMEKMLAQMNSQSSWIGQQLMR
ncbi:flagellar filament capping protein FliD [Tissierella pigra]|uniref:flagellar filament capping protein FliD n=1 Tax=Tissierella pigra TaxID=2607614 RepID=UPI001C103B69|nr:flagellar filament capping protein FliD [Tissierella pigra]MBU5427774.1 flagellar filament capping protein FliD [Tissierella pigra]